MHGSPGPNRDPLDFYPTPSWVTKVLLKREHFGRVVWEPACGDGAISTALEESGYKVISSDVEPRGCGVKADFLSADVLPDSRIKAIITNPPYSHGLEFIEKALNLGVPKVAVLMRYTFLEGQKRFHTLYNTRPPARVWLVVRRMVVLGKTSQFAHAWIVWDRKHRGPTELGWLN